MILEEQTETGVTTSRATSGDRKNDPNTSGQRWNNFHTSYIDRSFVVSGNNRVVKPKCKQFTSLNKMLSNSKVLIVHISFTALINNEGIGGIRKVPRRIKCTFCSCRKQSCCKAEMLPSYTSLLKKIKQFSSSFNWNNTFNALLTNGSIGEGIGDTGKGIKKNDINVM